MTQIDSHKGSCCFSSALSSAALEWSLMLLLFLNAIFSCVVTKFARFCKLQTPCLLCSRLDHIFGHEKPGFYRDLICESHKSEISLLVDSRVHQKLANVCEMCEGCLASFSMEKKYNPEMYRLLVGKIGMDPDYSLDDYYLPNGSHEGDVAEVPLLNMDPDSNSLVTNHCSCCSVPMENKLYAGRFLQNRPMKMDSDEIYIPLSKSPRRKHEGDGSDKMLEKSLSSPLVNHSGNYGVDHLSRIGYSEVNVTSDSESEVPFSDDEDGIIVGHEIEDFKEDVSSRFPQPESDTFITYELSATFADDTALEKSIHTASVKLESSLPIPEKQLVHIGTSHDVSSVASTVAIGHSLEEINWNKVEVRNNPHAPWTISETIVPEFPNVEDLSGNCNVARFSIASSEEISTSLSSTELNLKMSPRLSVPFHIDLNDAYKFATGNKSNLPSPNVSEVITGRDSFRVYEDLKLLISQMSAARGLETSWNDLSLSPRVQAQGDDFKFSDASSSTVLQNITKRLSIERNESGSESLDGSIVSEIEGESLVDRLKRQLELDRKSLYLLYKELEEERSASAIAANQAMAMITRLQEEKAAMQMEALQYQRMMEEQAEYDNDVLQKSNELLAQREKDIHNFEADIERYRQLLGDASLEVNNTPDNEFTVPGKFEQADDPFLGFEDEKSYILDRLKELEKKLHLFSNKGVYVDMPRLDMEEDRILNKPRKDEAGENNQQTNDWYSKVAIRDTGLENPHCNFVPQEDNHTIHGVLSEDSPLARGYSNDKVGSCLLIEASSENYPKESFTISTSTNDTQDSSTDVKASNLAALHVEVSHLNERLEALEADRSFLVHTMNSLKNGDSGRQFIQEIAYDLRQLQRIGITRREKSVA